MKHAVVRALGISLGIGLVTSPIISAVAISRPTQHQPARAASRFSHSRRERGSFGGESAASLARAVRPQDAKPGKQWMLEPRTFNMLSAGGKRAALFLNGLLPLTRTSPEVNIQENVAPQQTAPGDNVRVDNNPNLDDFGHTHSETSIAVNGATIVESFNDAGIQSSGYAVSFDGGNTFTHKRIPSAPNSFNFGDGVVAFGPSGELYYSQIEVDSKDEVIVTVSKSIDNGATFSLPVNASTSANGAADDQDKPWMTADRNAGSPNKGNVYVSWSDFTSNGNVFINLARSTDNGASFSSPVALSPKNSTAEVSGSIPAVAPNGDLYVAYYDGSINPGGGITIVKSTDGGKNFGSPKTAAAGNLFVINQLVPGGNGVRITSFPNMAIDKNGAIHIVYDAESQLLSPDRSDIFYVRSTDGGNMFSQPKRINDDTGATTQLFPNVAAAADGTVGIKWWDRRDDPINDSLNGVYMTTSTDGGATFGKNFRATDHNWVFGPVDLKTNSPAYHGDYDGLAADASNFYVSWSDERNSSPDAYFAFFPINHDPNTPDFNISCTKVYGSTAAGASAAFDFTTAGVNGFSGTLNLSATPPLPGLTYNFDSTSVASGSMAHLTVNTAPGTAPGTYLITVAAAGPTLTRRTNFRLTVYDPNRIVSTPADITNTAGFTLSRSGVLLDQSGAEHLLFDDDTRVAAEGSQVFYSRSVDGGHTFSAPLLVSTNSPVSFDSALTLDSAGNIYASWASIVLQDGSERLFFSKSTDHGNSFSTPISITPSAQVPDIPALGVDKNGNIVLSYVEFSGNVTRLFAIRSVDGGSTFSTPAQVSSNSQDLEFEPSVAFDSKGAAYISYNARQSALDSVFVAVASDGTHFNTTTMIPTSVSAFAPNITVDRSDNLYVAFYNRFGTSPNFNREVMVSRSCDGGNSFSPPVDVSNNTGQSISPHITADSRGMISVAWADDTNNDEQDIFLSRSSDGGLIWESSINVSANSGFSQSAKLTSDSSGNLLISWTDDSAAQPDVFLATAPGLSTQASDFGLAFPANVTLTRGTSDTLNVFIRRFGGFSGTVTVNPPDLSGLRIKLKGTGGSPQSTSCVNVSFSIKVKGGGVTGPQQITFTAQDNTGRSHAGVMNVTINPSQ